MSAGPITEQRVFAARSRVAVDLKTPAAVLSELARTRLFRDGPLHGYPLLNRLRFGVKETHYALEELAALILELKRIAPSLEAEPLALRTALLLAVTAARDAQRNVYVVPA